MSFYKEDRAKYIKSGQRLSNKMLKSVAEYFKNIFNLQVADGSLGKKCEHQIKQRIRRQMCHEHCASGLMRRSAMWRNNVTEVMIVTAAMAISAIAMTTSGRIVVTAVIVITRTNTKRNRRTEHLLIAVIRHSSHAWCMGWRASTCWRSATRTPRTTNVKFKTKTLI
jgi:hypothetical protein